MEDESTLFSPKTFNKLTVSAIFDLSPNSFSQYIAFDQDAKDEESSPQYDTYGFLIRDHEHSQAIFQESINQDGVKHAELEQKWQKVIGNWAYYKENENDLVRFICSILRSAF